MIVTVNDFRQDFSKKKYLNACCLRKSFQLMILCFFPVLYLWSDLGLASGSSSSKTTSQRPTSTSAGTFLRHARTSRPASTAVQVPNGITRTPGHLVSDPPAKQQRPPQPLSGCLQWASVSITFVDFKLSAE